MKKKEFLTEAKKKAILADREKAIVESFSKNFNKIKRLDESYGMSFEEAKAEAKRISDEEGGVAKHINQIGSDKYIVSDFYDADTTVASFGLGIDEESRSVGSVLKSKDYEVYHKTLASALDEAQKYVENNYFEIPENGFNKFTFGGVKYGENKKDNIHLNHKGQPTKNRFLAIQIYRMDSGTYELNMYLTKLDPNSLGEVYDDGVKYDIDETSMMKMDEGTSTGVSDMLVTLDYDNDMTKIEDKHYHNGPDGSIDYEIDTIESNFDFDDTMSIVEDLISKHKWNKIYVTVVFDGEEHKDSFDAIYWKGLNYWIKNQINEYDGEDYEKASREVQYGINPYEEEQSLFDGVDRILVSRPEYMGAVTNTIYGIYIIYKNGEQQKIRTVEEFNQKFGTDIPLTKDPRQVVSYLETNHPEVTVYLDEFDVS